MNDNKALGDAAREYLESMKKATIEDRSAAQQEINRFVRWFSPDLSIRELRPSDIERYVEDVLRTAQGSSSKLQPVREMLAYSKKQGYTSENLGTHVRIRRGGKKEAKGAVKEQTRIQMTAEGLEQLRLEREELMSLRPQISEELARAMADKDFRENAPLDAARDRQAQVEARIRDVEAQLRLAVVVSNEQNSERVTLGRKVILWDIEEEEEVSFQLVSPNEVDPRRGRISTASPIGRVLLDRHVGEEVEAEAPMGRVRYRVQRIE